MALTAYQASICKLLAQQRIAQGESYVAVGAALGEATKSSRLSDDIDLFHDTEAAVAAAWDADRATLERDGHTLHVVRERPTFIEAVVRKQADQALLQWAVDSAYRFFPLVEHEVFGLALHPFDLATNKVLALVGRLEVRDWVDVLAAHEHIQPLGYLAFAACGKDPGFSPASILDQAGRSARYSHEEVDALSFEGTRPSASELSEKWHAALDEARVLIKKLPAARAGCCCIAAEGALYRGTSVELDFAMDAQLVSFRSGSIRGVLPTIRST